MLRVPICATVGHGTLETKGKAGLAQLVVKNKKIIIKNKNYITASIWSNQNASKKTINIKI